MADPLREPAAGAPEVESRIEPRAEPRLEPGAGGPPRHQHDAQRPRERDRPRAPRGAAARRLPHVAAIALAVLPLVSLVVRFLMDDLGGEPIDALEKASGRWAIRFLALALAITPLRRLVGWSWLAPLRRTMGLLAFSWATVHLLIYFVLDMTLDVGDVVEDVVKHPYITIGMTSWLLLLALAITSTQRWTRRLGGPRWQRLHQLVYVVAVLATIHYYWSQKKDVTQPLLFAAIFAGLFTARAAWARRRLRST